MIPDKAFYVEPESVSGESFIINKFESNHATRVLRLKINDEIALLDGKGIGYTGQITRLDNIVSGKILQSFPNLGENNFQIILAPALIKRDRFELLLEKAVELGVTEIYPVIMDRCVKNKLNLDRCKKLIQSASKQTLRSRFPVIHEPTSLPEILKLEGQKVCAMIGEDKSLSQLDLSHKTPVIVIVGPEGDFSEKEAKLMHQANIRFYSLGERRLRAETASVNSLSVLNELLNR